MSCTNEWQETEDEILFLMQAIKEMNDPNGFYIVSRKGKDDYSFKSTLRELEYDFKDIINELKSLKVSEYLKTVKDFDRPDTEPLRIFIKTINHKQVYIKIKVRGEPAKMVICISFHFARREELGMPYREK